MVFNFSQTPISRVSKCFRQSPSLLYKTLVIHFLKELMPSTYMHLLENREFVEASIEESINVSSDY